MRCWVKSRQRADHVLVASIELGTLGRLPVISLVLPAFRMGTHKRLPVENRRKVRMTSNHHAPYALGYTHATMADTTGCNIAR